MYIIQVKTSVYGMPYFLSFTGSGYSLQGLKNNATKFPTMEAARSKMFNFQRRFTDDKIIKFDAN